jgi:DNA-binding NarL/FixJ family response regulator
VSARASLFGRPARHDAAVLQGLRTVHLARPLRPAVSVVLVDDHPAVLAGVQAWCAAAEPPIKVLASGATADVASSEPGRRADVVVLDLHLPGTQNDLDDLRELADGGRNVVVYSMRDDPPTALAALELGAATYLTKAEGQRHLIAAIMAAAEERPYTPPSLAGAMGTDSRPSRPRLAPRETDVLLEWFRSESKNLVAQKLGISVRTVDTYIDRVRIKYASVGRPAGTKAALVARAIQDGLVRVEEL